MFTAPETFINLPVKDLPASIEFFTKLGFTFNPQFTNETGTCMLINDNTFIMLLVEPFFSTFINKQISDSTRYTEVLISLAVLSVQEIKDKVAIAIEAGGTSPLEPTDSGWMYSWGFQDLDGHIWELVYMDIEKMPKQ